MYYDSSQYGLPNNQTAFNLGEILTLPKINTAVELSKSTMLFIVGVLVIVAVFVFKPFKKRR